MTPLVEVLLSLVAVMLWGAAGTALILAALALGDWPVALATFVFYEAGSIYAYVRVTD